MAKGKIVKKSLDHQKESSKKETSREKVYVSGLEEVDEETKSVLEYLLIHREDLVSLSDIQRATRLEQSSILEILSQLSKEEIVSYQLNQKSQNAREYIKEFRNRLTNNFLRAYKEAE